MLISEKWLRQWAPVSLSHVELCARLTMLGLEIGTVEAAAPLYGDKVVVGRIEQALAHENADRLQLCKVNVGAEKLLDIVCGAKNARQGLYVAVALVGAELPGLSIKQAQIRGVDSFGMLCSLSELGMADNSDGIAELAPSDLGLSIDDYFDNDDNILEVELTPNRADCLSAIGVARDLAAVSDVETPTLPNTLIPAEHNESLSIKLEASDDCPRYAGRIIHDIDMNAPTPLWMLERLRRSGIRSKNAVVDITNYVMLEIGQPMHAFDLDKIEGGIIVRHAQKGEKLTLLDDSEVTLSGQNLVIADYNKSIALAGIMGGANSCVDDNTKSIYLESAFFSPKTIAGKARELSMHTDSSHRFERGVDFNLQEVAVERATELLIEIAGGKPGVVHVEEDRSALPQIQPIDFNPGEIRRILGFDVEKSDIAKILSALGMQVKEQGEHLLVTPPSWRFDIRAAHDLVEEIGRCYGYDAIEMRMPVAHAPKSRISESQVPLQKIITRLTERGYSEAITYSFVDQKMQEILLGQADEIYLANPIADNMAVMRRSLFPGLLQALQGNYHRQLHNIRLFEAGNVFYKDSAGEMQQRLMLGAVVHGDRAPLNWSQEEQAFDFFDIKSDALSLPHKSLIDSSIIQKIDLEYLHPGQSAALVANNKTLAVFGKIHPAIAEKLDITENIYLFEWQLEPLLFKPLPTSTAVSKFPSVQRDLALIVDSGIAVGDIVTSCQQVAGELLTNLELFDIYQGEHIEKNKKSLAFRFTFQANNASLKTEEIDLLQEKILQHLLEKHAATLRV